MSETDKARASHYLKLIKEWAAKLKEAGADLDFDSSEDQDRLIEAAKEVFEGLNAVAHEDD